MLQPKQEVMQLLITQAIFQAVGGGTQPLNRSASEGEQPDQTLLSPEIAVLEINAIHTLPVL